MFILWFDWICNLYKTSKNGNVKYNFPWNWTKLMNVLNVLLFRKTQAQIKSIGKRHVFENYFMCIYVHCLCVTTITLGKMPFKNYRDIYSFQPRNVWIFQKSNFFRISIFHLFKSILNSNEFNESSILSDQSLGYF